MLKYEQLAQDLLAQFVPYQTVNLPGNEQPLAEFIQTILQREGFSTEIQVVDENRANLIATIGTGNRKIILNGHLDVVPPGEGWSVPPFVQSAQGNRLYGRGSCDMKGGIAAMIAAAIKLKRENSIGDDIQLVLAFVADEEINGLGSKHFVRHFEKGRQNFVIIGEPTMNQIHIAHRGVVRLAVELRGRQCHAGRPFEGINALTMLGKFLVEIDRLNEQMQTRVQPVLPPPTVAATLATGGVKDNVVPGTAQVTLDFRTVPGDTVESLTRETEAILTRLFPGTDAGWSIRPFIEVLPGMTQPDAPVVQFAVCAAQKAQDTPPQIDYFTACCDMSCFTAAGFDTILCGPGNISQAHTLDEYLEKEQLHQSIRFYEQYVLAVQAE